MSGFLAHFIRGTDKNLYAAKIIVILKELCYLAYIYIVILHIVLMDFYVGNVRCRFYRKG